MTISETLTDAPPQAAALGPEASRAIRFLPGLAGLLAVVAALVASDTPPEDIARYAGYAVWSVLLPGTLVFRALRRRAHSLLEDLVLGAVTGLVLELAAWAVVVGLGLQSVAVLWPLAVVVPFLAAPRLRRHWRTGGGTPQRPGVAWALAGTVALTAGYYYEVALDRFPVLPTGEHSRIFGDLPYLISLAGNAKYHVPLTFPQASGEPLHYHWFAFAHMAMSSLVGGVDLPVVAMRLMVPALSALTVLVLAVVAQRLTGRAWAGPVAALLFFAVGEFTASFPDNVSDWTFGAPVIRLMSWISLSLTYSQPLLIALVGVVGDALLGPDRGRGHRRVPSLGRGAFVLAGLFALACSAAKASALPVVLAGLLLAGAVSLFVDRRAARSAAFLAAILVGAQLFATAVVFDFESYGLEVVPFGNVKHYWNGSPRVVLVVATLTAFLLNHQWKLLGAVPLLGRRRRPEPVHWFLLGGALAGPAAYLAVNGFNASYFTIASAPLAALLSAWGCCEVAERADLSGRAWTALAAGALLLAGGLTYGIHQYGDRFGSKAIRLLDPHRTRGALDALLPMLAAAAAVVLAAGVGVLLWKALSRVRPALRRRGGAVLLTALVAVGLPGLALDVLQSRQYLWEGTWVLPASQVEAARWVRDHSEPSDVLVTNSHCWEPSDHEDQVRCDNVHSQWLSAYSERSVLVEGWAYAPRMVARAGGAVGSAEPFWDQELFRRNEAAITRPTAELLAGLHHEEHVRFLVVDRKAGHESRLLAELSRPVFDNGRAAVYELS